MSDVMPCNGGYNYDSSTFRRPFECLSEVNNHSEVTGAADPLAEVTLTYFVYLFRPHCSSRYAYSSNVVGRGE